MRKICVVLTARTSYTKIKPILISLRKEKFVELQLVLAASAVLEKYGNTDKMVVNDGFKINEKVYMTIESESLLNSAKSTGLGIIEFSGAFNRLKPDLVMVMADRFEVISAAISAAYQNIPLAHIQGGEVSGNIDEKVRHAITKLADFHFPATLRAKEWIIKMGENPDNVFFTGCPSTDIAKKVINKPDLNFDLYEKYGGVGSFPNLKNRYIVVMQHPVTTEHDKAEKQIEETLNAIKNINKSVIWFWPNPDAGGDSTSKAIRRFREQNNPKHLHFIKNMDPEDFLRLVYNSDGIVGNSSCAIRECSFLGIPAVNIGTRQSNRERSPNVVDVDYDRMSINKAINDHCNGKVKGVTLYGDGTAGEKIAKICSKIQLSFSKSINYL
tara:strand:+ start:6500 stop:7651 length:1152 start_codon:yes stop_codon:yes gene_type:complete